MGITQDCSQGIYTTVFEIVPSNSYKLQNVIPLSAPTNSVLAEFENLFFGKAVCTAFEIQIIQCKLFVSKQENEINTKKPLHINLCTYVPEIWYAQRSLVHLQCFVFLN